ncbi:MAG: type II toxin-antitoxin system mRNA interferase toxin, RelE/StbE family [Lachnospiraceae bacterium]|nr:type II toxin-antitoxin system mRNA interferase toxin, RelE/StbE family [Lachnospiraceae bacterium]
MCHNNTIKSIKDAKLMQNWLLIYQIYEDTLVLSATATGSHADLFG